MEDMEERTGCFTYIVFLVLLGYYRSLPLHQGAMGWSAVCDCGISWSYSLTYLVPVLDLILFFVSFLAWQSSSGGRDI